MTMLRRKTEKLTPNDIPATLPSHEHGAHLWGVAAVVEPSALGLYGHLKPTVHYRELAAPTHGGNAVLATDFRQVFFA